MDTNQFMTLCDGITAEVRQLVHGSRFEMERVKIKEALSSTDVKRVPYADFTKLHTAFIYLSVIDNTKDYSPYYYILEKVREHFNGATKEIADWSTKAWKDVIAYCKSLPEYPKTNAFTNGLMYVRERTRASAAKRLESIGAALSMQDNELKIDHQEAVFALIESLITDIGGARALDLMMKELPYENRIGRYLVPHQGNMPMASMVEIETPYGYLLNLCLKHIGDAGRIENAESKWSELKDIAKDVCLAVYDSQKFDVWGDVLFQPEGLVGRVHELVIRFGLYTLPQTNVSFTLDWCRFVCKSVSRDPRCGLMMKQQMEIVQRIINLAAKLSCIDKCVTLKKGSKAAKLVDDNKTLLGSFIVKDARAVNTGYDRPDDFDKVNAMRYPIIETDSNYILIPKTLGVWSWFEAIYNIVRQNRILGKELGVLMEGFIRNKMKSHGLQSHTGEYTFTDAAGNDVAGEVDFLIESENLDVIMESKKKALTQPARSGDDYYIWGDLYEMIYSQMQCAKLETAAKKHGPVDVREKTGETYSYNWLSDVDGKKRYVVKATMTLKEYGPMQDKIIIDRIIRNLIGKKLNVAFDPADTVHNADDQKSITETIENINKALESLTAYYSEVGDANPTFFCRFYSMEQVYFLIKQAKSQNHFAELLRGAFVTMGTENFWNEYVVMAQSGIEETSAKN